MRYDLDEIEKQTVLDIMLKRRLERHKAHLEAEQQGLERRISRIRAILTKPVEVNGEK